jgi:hypothetical protein
LSPAVSLHLKGEANATASTQIGQIAPGAEAVKGKTLKRVNVYVDPDDLRRVAEELGCRPSEAVRRLIDNHLLAVEVDEVRRLPGRAPEPVCRRGRSYEPPDLAADAPNDLSGDA